MKDITFICGAIVSGTSMIMKLCLDHGAWGGLTVDASQMNYDVYENSRFRQLCRNAIGLQKDLEGEDLNQLFQAFFDSLPEGEKIVLKYPKSFYLLPGFMSMLGPNFKVVYVLRNPFQRAVSVMKKNGGNQANLAWAMQDWNEAYTFLSQKTKGIDLYPVLYERFFIEPELETKKLVDFIGLSYDKIDVSSIDTGKKHF